MTELRLIRTAERIETLKSQARWGLRQVKKQRAVGGLMKTHWDYLLDEMVCSMPFFLFPLT
jgi:chromatin modification-related protein VID21